MNAPDGQKCAAPERRCGTATGWRGGGRCPACRLAHNEETNRYRRRTNTPDPGTVAALGARVADGQDITEAARALGIHPSRARSLLGTTTADGAATVELLRALAAHLVAVAGGGPPDERAPAWRAAAPALAEVEDLLTMLDPRQREMRDGKRAIVAALKDGAPNLEKAALQVGLSFDRVAGWHARNPEFKAACDAARAVSPSRRVVTTAWFDQAAALLEGGAGVIETAKAVGVSRQTLRNRAKGHPRLAAALPPKKSPGRPPWKQSPDGDDWLKQAWPDSTTTIKTMAAHLGVSEPAIISWARRLGLPPRRRPKGGS